MQTALSELRANAAMLDQLTGWLTAAEANLSAHAHEMLPENLPIIEQLFQDHQVCPACSFNKSVIVAKLLLSLQFYSCVNFYVLSGK